MTGTRSKVLVFPYFRDEDGRVLYAIFKKVDTPLGRREDYWQSIAGGVEPGETFFDAAGREAREEAGIESSDLIELDSRSSYKVGGTRVVQAAFAVETRDRNVVLSEEHSEVRWLPIEDALKILKFDDYKVAIRELDARVNAAPGHGQAGRGPE